ncbi:hypothetical protein MXD62_16935 [Frankia sp. Mgl5]|nr:hypothetical protein [Frankia sp. Mgl5]MCK9928843.1 hypothetical protein [Frankia sp. Mgl5]
MAFDDEPEDEVEDVDALVAAWQEETARLRVVAVVCPVNSGQGLLS